MKSFILTERLKGIMLVFIATACWGSAAVFIRFFPNIDAISLVWARYAVALLFFSFIAFYQRHDLVKLLKTKRKRWIFINALCMIGTTGFLTLAVKTGTVASAVFLLYVIPLFVTALYRLIAEKQRINSWLSIAIMFSALGVFSIFMSNLGDKFVWGDIWGFLAGLIWGVQMIVGRKLSEDYPSQLGMFLIHIVALVVLVPFVNFTSLMYVANIPLLILYGILASVVATFTFYKGIRMVTYTDASIIALFDPIIAAAGAFFILTEVPSLGIVIGSIFIIAGNVIQVFSEDSKIPQLMNIDDYKKGPFVGRYIHG
jgi:drug/metabolite transporter (DMT)-like permease